MTTVRRVAEGAARRTAVQRANDHTLEVVIFGLRGLSMLCSLLWLVATAALIWTADLRWLASMAFLVVVGGVCTWFGFLTFANQEWRNDAD